MRWASIVVVMVLGGCSRENPWFSVDDGEASPGATIADPGSGPDTTPADTTGLADTGPASNTDTEGDTTTTSGPEDTGGGGTEGMTGTGTTGTTGTSDTIDTSTSDTTGGPAIEATLWSDLWWRCGHSSTQWAALGAVPGELHCWLSLDEPPDQWVGPGLPFVFMDQLEPKVLALVPAPGDGNAVIGTFNGLKLPPDAMQPHLRAVVVCPGFVADCAIEGALRVERAMQTIVEVEPFSLAQGQHQQIDLDLAKYPALLDGEPFTVVLAVTLHGEAPGNRGLWLRPRIVELID